MHKRKVRECVEHLTKCTIIIYSGGGVVAGDPSKRTIAASWVVGEEICSNK